MATLSIPQTYQLLRGAGFNPLAAVQMTAIGRAESGLRTDAVGDVGLQNQTWGPSVGLFQVRSLNAETGRGTSRDRAALLSSPAKQARAAYEISNGGRNFTPWSTWTSGAAARNLPGVYSALGMHAGQAPPASVDAAPLPASPDPSSAAAGDGTVSAQPAGWNPIGGWVGDLSTNLRKLTITGVALTAGAGLLVFGFVRLVAPVASRAVESAL